MFDPGKHNTVQQTAEEACALYKRLDATYQTSKHSPLHHDNRCHLPGHFQPDFSGPLIP